MIRGRGGSWPAFIKLRSISDGDKCSSSFFIQI